MSVPTLQPDLKSLPAKGHVIVYIYVYVCQTAVTRASMYRAVRPRPEDLAVKNSYKYLTHHPFQLLAFGRLQ